MEAALMVVRTLTGLTGGLAAGIVLARGAPDPDPVAHGFDGSAYGLVRAGLRSC